MPRSKDWNADKRFVMQVSETSKGKTTKKGAESCKDLMRRVKKGKK